MAQPQNKRSFEFRMSKKVAELTQVVHMLFTRNHEKEVEIEAIKDSYEHEIELVIDDAKNKIRHLEVKVQELQQQQVRRSLKTESCHDGNIGVTGATGVCRYDNPRYTAIDVKVGIMKTHSFQ